ncbi:MAG: hypothetical protein HOC91_10470 [Nitrospinaceae bacterium]|mgnify:FL=1|nr:hypothetical protein [Nitrospinaceae bacterium]MBT3435387.1 hypothetical protein [Nitrospinaceae bacterium]MBT3820195.1 hypothetical protein [Nitrospinaceae bacterium]MBT4093227.1 hypothetical protein [Nitrospinaceae bacterium]MBT4430928.1 hypothetical protein [Nitrospinaceae bacterium]
MRGKDYHLSRPESPFGISIHLLLIGLYLALTLGMTYPVANNLFTRLPVWSHDGLQNYWNLWWFKTALMDLGTNPLFTNQLFHPVGTTLTAHTLAPYNGLIGIPLQALFGLMAAFNILYLSTFVLSGYGMHLLIHHLTKNHAAAFVGALIFAFSPYHMMHAQNHLHLMTIQYIPLFALYLVRLSENPCTKNGIAAGIFMALTALCSWNYFLFFLIFILVFMISVFANERTKVINLSFIRGLCWLGGVCFVIISPFLIPLARDILTGTVDIAGERFARAASADLAAYFVPSNLHPLWGGNSVFQKMYTSFAGGLSEGTVAFGYAALALAGVALLRSGWRNIYIWVITLATFMALSLGPDLQIFGEEYLGFTRLPYNWFIQNTPFLKGARIPARFAVMASLAISVLAGWGMKSLLDNLKPNKKTMLIAGATALILFEFQAVHPSIPVSIPKPYTYFAQDSEAYAVLEVPVGLPQNASWYMAYQTAHRKPIISGYISRVVSKSWKFIENDPFVRLLHFPERITSETINTKPAGLIKHKIKYVLVHKTKEFYEFLDNPYFDHTKVRYARGKRKKIFLKNIHELLLKHTKRSPLSSDNIIVYQVY